MPFAWWPKHDFRQNVVLVAPALIGTLLLCTVATALHDGHDHGHAKCPICWLAKAPICAPEAAPPPPAPEMWPELIALRAARPTCQPFFTFAARAPPAELL